MYGTKDAAQCFDVASENAMTAMRYDTSKFSPCLHHSSAVAMSVFRHGDDFVVSDTRTQRKEFEKQLSNHLMVKHLATLGPYTSLTEVRMLNRIVRWVKPPNGSGHERIRYETDPRHAELTIHQFGLSNSARSVSTPSGKSKPGVDLARCSTVFDLHFVSISHDETVILRWKDGSAISTESWRAWRCSKESPDVSLDMGVGSGDRARNRGIVSCWGVR